MTGRAFKIKPATGDANFIVAVEIAKAINPFLQILQFYSDSQDMPLNL
jgi:hypothetical protein